MALNKDTLAHRVKALSGEIIFKLRGLSHSCAAIRKGLTKVDACLREATTIHRIPNSQKKRRQIRWLFEVTSGIDCGRQYIGITKVIKIGRALENHIQLRDSKVSRFHAVICQQGSMLTIRDLNSTNGTRVNDQVVHNQKKLFPGDLIQLGETVIRVESDLPVESQS
ncbi:MAG: FHA domain-containing protein [Firmicutes bacterium]|nr:FHA domain-containing protein [Bacillota bacterium]